MKILEALWYAILIGLGVFAVLYFFGCQTPGKKLPKGALGRISALEKRVEAIEIECELIGSSPPK